VAAAALAYACGGRRLAAARIAELDELAPLRRRLDGARHDWSLAELVASPTPVRDEIVPGLLHAGLSLLGAPTLAGKSFLTLEAALAVGSGGGMAGLQAPVLYLPLEDPPARLGRRLHQLGAAQGPSSARGKADLPIRFHMHWPALDAEGLPLLAHTLAQRCFGPEPCSRARTAGGRRPYRLVVVDTLSTALSPTGLRSRQRMLDVLLRLHALAAACNAALLLVDRHPYPARSRPLDAVDRALAAAFERGLFEQAITLSRPFGQQRAELRFAGSSRPIILALHPDIDSAGENSSR
jgi:hypothetical protein